VITNFLPKPTRRHLQGGRHFFKCGELSRLLPPPVGGSDIPVIFVMSRRRSKISVVRFLGIDEGGVAVEGSW
jgi:hypothetical protein